MNTNEINTIKDEYRPGTRIQMVKMEDPYHPIPEGTCGTVVSVDDIGTIHLKWDDGSSLGVCPDEDIIKVLEYPYVRRLYRTGKNTISCHPLNEDSIEIPSSSVFDDEFDIIENDLARDYGYTEISFIEGKYRAEYYKHRLPIKYLKTYAEAIDEIHESSNYSEGDKDTLDEALDEHFDWWLSPIRTEDIGITNIPVFSLTDEEIKNLLDNGFLEERIFIRRI